MSGVEVHIPVVGGETLDKSHPLPHPPNHNNNHHHHLLFEDNKDDAEARKVLENEDDSDNGGTNDNCEVKEVSDNEDDKNNDDDISDDDEDKEISENNDDDDDDNDEIKKTGAVETRQPPVGQPKVLSGRQLSAPAGGSSLNQTDHNLQTSSKNSIEPSSLRQGQQVERRVKHKRHSLKELNNQRASALANKQAVCNFSDLPETTATATPATASPTIAVGAKTATPAFYRGMSAPEQQIFPSNGNDVHKTVSGQNDASLSCEANGDSASLPTGLSVGPNLVWSVSDPGVSSGCEIDGVFVDGSASAGVGGAGSMSFVPKTQSANFLQVVEAEDDLSDWESPIDVDLANQPIRRSNQSSWRKIRSFILWSPFIQVFKKHRYPWIQLAGHQGNFHAGEAGSVLKRLDPREQACFQKVMNDRLKDFVPEYRGDVEKNGDTFIQLQDLLCSFTYPCVMDIKMGVRTYLEDELHKARKSPTLRKDMYQKMIEVDSSAPTTEEHEQKAVTKPRYMQWRDEMSSSVELGFRVEGIKKSDGNSSKDFKKTKTRQNIVDILKSFVGSNETIVAKYISRLKDLMATQESSEFFLSHEVIGSSLLFVHDADENVNVWMIDFGKTEPLPKGVTVDHRKPWKEGNHEDGYLFGLDNLISMLEEVYSSLTSTSV